METNEIIKKKTFEIQQPIFESVPLNYSLSVITLLEDIFLKTDEGELTQIIKNVNNIPNLLNFLNYSNKEDEKIEIIEYLTFNFKYIHFNANIFLKSNLINKEKFEKPKDNLVYILINCYLTSNEEKMMRIVKECIEQLIINVDFKKEIYDYIIQMMSKYFRTSSTNYCDGLNQSDTILDKQKLSKYLNLLKTLYGEKLSEKKPRNYIYFTGKGGLKLIENFSKSDKIKMDQGCVITLWFMITPGCHAKDTICDLVNLKFSKDQSIKICLRSQTDLIFLNNPQVDVIKSFTPGEWNLLSIVIKPKTFLKGAELNFIFSNGFKSFQIPKFNSESELLEATFFQNFIGQTTSILYLSKNIHEEYIKLLREFPFGLNKEKDLYKLLKKADAKYMDNSDLKIQNQMNSGKDTDGFITIVENIKFLLTPFRSSSEKETIIVDVCGKYNASLFNNDLNDVHIYRNLTKNIFLLGGINAILPIIELIFTNEKLLDVDIFCEYIDLIYIILNYSKKNMSNAVSDNFFLILSLFLEKFPEELFNQKVLNLFLRIGRRLFSFVDECVLCNIFFDHILLNEKIFTKFDINSQIEMWKSLYQFYVSDSSQIKSFMKMSKISLVLRYYDMKKFSHYCCTDHHSHFNHEGKNEFDQIMNPEMPVKIENLINLIQLIIDNHNPESNEALELFKILSLDISPCLQKNILIVFTNYFNSNSLLLNKSSENTKRIENKIKTMNKLLNQGHFTEVILYMYSISLLDIRCEVLRLLNILSASTYRKMMKKIEQKYFVFLKDYLLPSNLYIYKVRQLKSDDNLVGKRERGLGVSHKKDNYFKKSTLNESKSDKNLFLEIKEGSNGVKAPISARHANKSFFKFDSIKVDSYIKNDNVDKEFIIDSNHTLNVRTPFRKTKLNNKFVFDVIKEEMGSKKNTSYDSSLFNTNKNNEDSSVLNIDQFVNKKKTKIGEISFGKKPLTLNLDDETTQIQETIEYSFPYKTCKNKLLIMEEKENQKLITDDEESYNKAKSEVDSNSLSKKDIETNNIAEDKTKTLEKINLNKFEEFEEPTQNPFTTNKNNVIKSHSNSMELGINQDDYSSPVTIIRENKNPIKKGGGFSTINLRKTVSGISLGMKLDIENINKQYKFGGEKAELNIDDGLENKEMESKIRSLAKHCVEFINGESKTDDCKNPNFGLFSFQYLLPEDSHKEDSKNARNLEGLRDNIESKFINEPRSVKGTTTKLSFSKFSIMSDNIIEEDPSDSSPSPFKNLSFKNASIYDNKISLGYDRSSELSNQTSENNYSSSFKSFSNENDLNVVKQKLSFDNVVNAIPVKKNKDEKLLVVDDYITYDSEIISQNLSNTNTQQNLIDSDLESLYIHFNKEKYDEILYNFYNILLEWLLNKQETEVSRNSCIYIDELSNIINPSVVNLIIKFAINSEDIYIQKLMQDLHLLLINNKENCVILLENEFFYKWLIETSFKYYQLKCKHQDQDDNPFPSKNERNLSPVIYQLSKKIHTVLIKNVITREEKLQKDPMIKIYSLLSWGVYYKNIYEYSKKIIVEVNEFIKSLLEEILSEFKEKVISLKVDIELPIIEYFVSFSIICHEYMTFFNLEKLFKTNMGIKHMSFENIVNGLNISSHFGNSRPKNIEEIWKDFRMFEAIYFSYQKKFCSIHDTIFTNLQKVDNLVIKYEKIIEEYFNNKKQKDVFMKDLRILTYFFSPGNSTYNNYKIPLIKALNNLFLVTIYFSQNENEVKFWLQEYEKFLIVIIIASINLSMNSLDYYNMVQDLCSETITYGLKFLLDEYFSIGKNPLVLKHISKVIKNVFVLLVMIMDEVYKYIEKHGGKNKFSNLINKNIFSNLIKPNKKKDFTKSSVYKIFNEFILDENGAPILTKSLVNELKLSQFVDVPQIFNKKIWRRAFIESSELKEKLKKVLNFNVFETILKDRSEEIKKFVPVYEHKLTIKSSDDGIVLKTQPENLSIQANNLKNNIHRQIELLIPQFDFDIKKYKNSLFISSKERKKLYRLLKKKLFSWRGMWSDREVFFNQEEKLKSKILNHYTSFFSRPIIVPVLDIEHYIPKFNKFDIPKIFQKNLDYNICLDIDKILNVASERSSSKILISSSSSSRIGNNNNNNSLRRFNYLHDIYKINSKIIWEKYSDIDKKLDIFTNKEHGYTELYSNKFRVKTNDNTLTKYETTFECCLVKISHHIRGLLNLDKDGLTFRILLNESKKILANSNDTSSNSSPVITNKFNRLESLKSFEIIENRDEFFNEEKNVCYGSILPYHQKDNDSISYRIPFVDIKLLFKKRYYYRKTGLEIFTILNKSYYLNFKSVEDRDDLIKSILIHLDLKREIKIDTKENVKDKEDLIIGYENLSNLASNLPQLQTKKNLKANYLTSKIESWKNWKISNFEFLMWLNLIGNRSFADLTQYPVFPWVITNYSGNKIELSKDIRDFRLPMGMMELNEKGRTRKNCYINDYKSNFEEMDMTPSVFGSHYSNSIYVCHYLTRLLPFYYIAIELQGEKLDDANRLFLSVENSFDNSTSVKGDIRELVPEFYFLPEFFMNKNNLHMGDFKDFINKAKQAVNDVQLPEWCDNNPYEFITEMKNALESEEVSTGINNWIDIIFGHKQKGKEAENIYNIFWPQSYDDFNLDSFNKEEKECSLTKLEFGLCPSQLLVNKPISEKFSIDHIRKGKQLTESKELRHFINNTTSKTSKVKEKPLMLKIKVLDNNEIICVFNNNAYNNCKFTPNDLKYSMDTVTKNYIPNENNSRNMNRMQSIYNECLVNHPMIIYNQGKVIAQAGYWNGEISVSYQEGNSKSMKLFYYTTQNSPIVTLTMDKEELWVFAGSLIGVLFIFKVNDFLWKLENTFYDHTDQITFISVSNSLNVFATSSLDGFVNLYTFPSNRLFRSVKIKDDVTADYVFLSSCPLPVFTVYSKISKRFYSYSINGFLLCDEFDECKYIMSPVILTDITFTDYLVYGTNTSEFKIRKFPNMSLHYKLLLHDYKNKSNPAPIKCIDISEDKKRDDKDITLIKDPSVTSEAATANLMSFGFAG